ncbi:MAG: DUF465 domain-containing protein [Deltaproteobacteria bacterium]|nr:DUF465 domain-containing protein [Deltaproteobacteria bacterium]
MEQHLGTAEDKEILTRLREEHRELDSRIRELEGQSSFSVAEQTEIKQLKKLKLQKKDQIFQMEQRLAVA